MKKTTRVNHPPAAPMPAGNHPVVAPIYQSVKFAFDSVDDTLRALRGERPAAVTVTSGAAGSVTTNIW
jgi:cystathionine beta-lyase/cystathionine gamma-synthase